MKIEEEFKLRYVKDTDNHYLDKWYKTINTKGKEIIHFTTLALLSINPIHDCQTYTIGSIFKIFQLPDFSRNYCLKLINSRAIKNQLLFNIRQEYESKVESVFKEQDIVIKKVYTSTRDTQMCLYLVKTKCITLLQHEEPKLTKDKSMVYTESIEDSELPF